MADAQFGQYVLLHPLALFLSQVLVFKAVNLLHHVVSSGDAFGDLGKFGVKDLPVSLGAHTARVSLQDVSPAGFLTGGSFQAPEGNQQGGRRAEIYVIVGCVDKLLKVLIVHVSHFRYEEEGSSPACFVNIVLFEKELVFVDAPGYVASPAGGGPAPSPFGAPDVTWWFTTKLSPMTLKVMAGASANAVYTVTLNLTVGIERAGQVHASP